MRRNAIPLLVILILFLHSSTVLSNDLITTRVVDVIDGDSIIVGAPDEKRVVIQLYGLDCPEEGQPFGAEAKQFTLNQCFGKIVLYQLIGIDIYERTIAVVFLEDGRELNLELLEAGLAWHTQGHMNRRDYAQAEEEARSAAIGLWAAKNPTPPWEWRQATHQNQ